MKVGFLVGSISREAGGLFQSVRGLAKAVMSTNTTASVFGISDPKSAVDLLEWRPLSVRTFRPQLRALCDAEAQSMQAYGMRNPICVIPNGVDLPESFPISGFGVQDSALLRVAGGRKVLLYLGRLHPKKNLMNLIRAWAETLNSQRS